MKKKKRRKRKKEKKVSQTIVSVRLRNDHRRLVRNDFETQKSRCGTLASAKRGTEFKQSAKRACR